MDLNNLRFLRSILGLIYYKQRLALNLHPFLIDLDQVSKFLYFFCLFGDSRKSQDFGSIGTIHIFNQFNSFQVKFPYRL